MLRPSLFAVIVLTLAALPAQAQVKTPPPNPPGFTTLLSIDSARITDLSVSPDGKWVAYARFDSDDGTMASIWMASMNNPKPFRVTSTGHLDRWPELSPTGNVLFFVSNRPNRAPHSKEVYVMAVTIDRVTGQPVGALRQVTTDSVVITGDISPDGKWMTYEPRGGAPLKLVSTSGGNARTLVTRHLKGPAYSTFSSDGKYVVYQDSGAALRKVPVAGGPAVTLVEPATTTKYALPYPGRDDRYIYARKPEGDTIRVEVRDFSGNVYGTMRFPKFYDSGPAGAHVRNDGRGLVGNRSMVNSQTYAIKRITFATIAVVDALPVSDADLVGEAPDGSIVLHHVVGGHEQLVIVSRDGKRTEVPLGKEIEDVQYLLPGGTHVLAFGEDTSHWQGKDVPYAEPQAAFAVNRASGTSRKVADAVPLEVLLCTSRDFESDPYARELAEVHGSTTTIETIDGDGNVHVAGSMPLATFERLEDVAAFGSRVAYVDSASNRTTIIYVTTGPGKTPVRLADLPSRGVALAWSPDGRRLAVIFGDKKSGLHGALRVFDVAADGTASATSPLLDIGGNVGFAASIAWLPDGNSVIVDRSEDQDHNVVFRSLDPARPPVVLPDVPNAGSLMFEPGGKSALFSIGHTVRGSSIWTADFVPVKKP